jgi:hypothetical protein
LEEGIHATRMLFPRMWFDSAKCKAGLEALARYQREYNKRLSEYRATPVHNWASHAAHALRTLGVAHKAAVPRVVDTTRGQQMETGAGLAHAWLGI